jgi:hypothetical protein
MLKMSRMSYLTYSPDMIASFKRTTAAEAEKYAAGKQEYRGFIPEEFNFNKLNSNRKL